jgi:hypothetical protein
VQDPGSKISVRKVEVYFDMWSSGNFSRLKYNHIIFSFVLNPKAELGFSNRLWHYRAIELL